MIVSASLRSLVRRRTRTLLALSGISVSAALLLDMTMLASGLTDSFEELLGGRGYGLRVTPRGILPFDSDATLRSAEDLASRIAGVPGVERVAPVLGAQFYALRDGAVGAPVSISGVDPSAQLLYRLVEGREPRAGEAVISAPLAEQEGLAIGDRLTLAPELDPSLGRPRGTRNLRVTGIAEFLYDHAGQRSAALLLPDVQQATGRIDQVSLFGVAQAEGMDVDSLAARIARVAPEASVLSLGTLLEETDRRLSYFRQLAAILASIALAVTALLVSTLITIGVRERYGEIATLRAMGVARGRILLGIVTEGLALTLCGSLLGLPLGLWMAERLDRILLAFPGLPADLTFFTWDAARIGTALGALVIIGALAGALPGVAALRLPLANALREEGD